MQDRPDLIQSELSGLAFDSLQCVFRPADIEAMFSQEPPEIDLNTDIYLFIDPAAGGPQSDYAILSFQRFKGLITVHYHGNYSLVYEGDGHQRPEYDAGRAVPVLEQGYQHDQ